MCCEDCPKYEKCYDDNLLKENCCPKCPEYNDCVGSDDKENYSGNSYNDYDPEKYL